MEPSRTLRYYRWQATRWARLASRLNPPPARLQGGWRVHVARWADHYAAAWHRAATERWFREQWFGQHGWFIDQLGADDEPAHDDD